MFVEDDPTATQPDAISAVKALQKAAADRQRIGPEINTNDAGIIGTYSL